MMDVNSSTEPIIISDYHNNFVEKIDYKYFNLEEQSEIAQYRTATLKIDVKHSLNIKLNYKLFIKNNTDNKSIRYIFYRFVVDNEILILSLII